MRSTPSFGILRQVQSICSCFNILLFSYAVRDYMQDLNDVVSRSLIENINYEVSKSTRASVKKCVSRNLGALVQGWSGLRHPEWTGGSNRNRMEPVRSVARIDCSWRKGCGRISHRAKKLAMYGLAGKHLPTQTPKIAILISRQWHSIIDLLYGF